MKRLVLGIVVRKGNVLQPLFFKWYDITNLVNHKRVFGIECQNYELSVQFLLDEPDSAKYVWKICKYSRFDQHDHPQRLTDFKQGEKGEGVFAFERVSAMTTSSPPQELVDNDFIDLDHERSKKVASRFYFFCSLTQKPECFAL